MNASGSVREVWRFFPCRGRGVGNESEIGNEVCGESGSEHGLEEEGEGGDIYVGVENDFGCLDQGYLGGGGCGGDGEA